MESTKTSLEVLEKRVVRLERENRWMKRAGSVLLLLMATALVMGQSARTQSVRANNFSLTDSHGRVQAEMKLELDGTPTLSFFDANKEANLVLVGGEVPGVVVGTDHHAMADLRAPSFGLDPQGKNTGAAALKFFDAQGKLRIELGAFKSGPSLDIADIDGYSAVLGTREITTPLSAGQKKTPASSLLLLDPDNKILWSAP